MRLKDHISSDSLLRKLGINNIQTLLRYNRLRWFGHVVRNDGCINSITALNVHLNLAIFDHSLCASSIGKVTLTSIGKGKSLESGVTFNCAWGLVLYLVTKVLINSLTPIQTSVSLVIVLRT